VRPPIALEFRSNMTIFYTLDRERLVRAVVSPRWCKQRNGPLPARGGPKGEGQKIPGPGGNLGADPFTGGTRALLGRLME
jgi:hypothetical protein